ncbi:hypothetical protein HK098_003307 [Nowakowskiella sp. JEL0407]|nr:hypothetical protein HK098_003307 [Nowakowskiella sp. JEL0407]
MNPRSSDTPKETEKTGAGSSSFEELINPYLDARNLDQWLQTSVRNRTFYSNPNLPLPPTPLAFQEENNSLQNDDTKNYCLTHEPGLKPEDDVLSVTSQKRVLSTFPREDIIKEISKKVRNGFITCDRCYARRIQCDMLQPRCSNCESSCTYIHETDLKSITHRVKNIQGRNDHDLGVSKGGHVAKKADRLKYSPTFSAKIPILNPYTYQPTITIPQYQLPFPSDVIDQLLFAFFPNIPWPVNVLHRSYLANRYHHSLCLLHSICAIGAVYEDIGVNLTDPGEFPGETFFKFGMGLINYENTTLDDACAILLLGFYCGITGKGRTLAYLTGIWHSVAEKFKVWLDPDDDDAAPPCKSFNLIEKETLRRLYWASSSLGIFVHTNPTTKRPLPDHVWVSLSDNMEISLVYRPNPKLIEASDINYLLNETGELLNCVRTLNRHCLTNSIKDLMVDAKAKEIRTALNAWENRILIAAPLINRPPASNTEWMGVHVHLMKHNIMLLAHRYLFMRFLEQVWNKSNKTTSENNVTEILHNLNSPYFNTEHALPNLENEIEQRNLEAEAFVACHSASKAVLRILKEVILEYDPSFKHAHVSLSICLMQLCVFLGILSQHADKQENRRKSEEEYYIVKVALRKMYEGNVKIAGSMLSALEEVERKGWIHLKDFLLIFFSWDVSAEVNL